MNISSYVRLDYNPYYFILLPNSSSCRHWDLLQCPFNTPHRWLLFSSASLSGIVRTFRHILYISSPRPGMSFLQEASVPFSQNGARSQDLVTRCTHCYWSVRDFSSSGLTENGNICVYTNPSICTYLNAFVSKHLDLCYFKHEFRLSLQQIHYCTPMVVAPLLIYRYPLQVTNLALTIRHPFT